MCNRVERRCGVIVDRWKQNGGAETPQHRVKSGGIRFIPFVIVFEQVTTVLPQFMLKYVDVHLR